MKKSALLLAALLMAFFAMAQGNVQPPQQPMDINQPGLRMDSVIAYLQRSLTAADSGEGGRASQVAKFGAIWRERVTHNDSSGANMFEQYFRAAGTAALARANATCNGDAFSGKWRIDGPDSFPTQNLGRMRDVWAHPTDTNRLLASGDGGVWKTTDGGKNWRCITDNAPVLSGIISPNKLAVNPNNPDNIYVGSYAYPNHVIWPQGLRGALGWVSNGANYGHGLLVTSDSGSSWHQEILPLHNPPQWTDSVSGAKPFFTPDGGRVYAFRANHLFYKQTSGSWQEITPVSLIDSSLSFYELKFARNLNGTLDPNHFFVTTHVKGKLLECFYDPNAQTHSFNRILFPTAAMDASVEGFYISIPTADMLYAAFKNKLYKYNIVSQNWAYIAAMTYTYQNGFINNMPNYVTDSIDIWEGGFEASPANPANLYLTRDFGKSYFSKDTGKSTVPISAYNGSTHTDVRGVCVQRTTNSSTGIDDRIYFACDGGIFMKPTGRDPYMKKDSTCVNINGKGLACGKYWGISSLEKDGTVFAGMMDNSQWSFNPSWSSPWQNFGAGDGGEATVSRVKKEGYIGVSGSGYTVRLFQVTPNNSGILNVVDTGVKVRQDTLNEIIPLWADQYGGYYVGQKDLWRILPDSMRPVIAKVSGTGIKLQHAQFDVHLPEYRDTTPSRNRHPIRCMSFSHYHDSLTGYVMFDDGALFYRNDYANPNIAHLFRQKNTTGFCKYFPPTDMVCDPVHPERVWLSLGGVNWGGTTPRNRVRYSPDAGDHWFDISKGLPKMLPVVNIEYQEGSPYVYAATDVGIYRLDMSTFAYTDSNNDQSAYNSVQWTCFNKGDAGNPDFPSINTPALNINYCSGRLYAATDGRGIWSTPLWEQFNVPPITESNVITTNTTWTGARYLTSGIRIKDGATLTPSPTAKIYMPKDGKIVVEAGAKLVVDGATLTNGCKDCMWGGIVAEGQAHLPQTPANQATVIVQNNALIEHARNAITTWGGNSSNAGAILTLSGSTFRNNKRSIEFISYHNQNSSGQRTANRSRISRCRFELSDDYRGTAIGYFFSTFISLWDVEGVVISGNSFANTNTTEANFGNGITSFNAAYQVLSACNGGSYPCNNFTPNTFSGLRHGVFAEGDNLTGNTFVVDQATFEKCGVGVLARTNNHFRVSRSAFDIGNAPFPYIAECAKNIGVRALSDCNGFRVEENTFKGLTAAASYLPKNIGVSLEYTGPDNKEIYKNTFATLDYGVLAAGRNGSYQRVNYPPGYVGGGALLTCNTFSNDFEALTLFAGALVHPEQATLGGGPSGNVFVNGVGWVVDNNSAPTIRYCHNGSANAVPQVVNVYLLAVSGNAQCPSRYEAQPEAAAYRLAFEAADSSFKGAGAAWQAHIDGGDTAQLLADIDHAAANDSVLVSRLLSLSPYVSEAALRHGGMAGKLFGSAYLSVLTANPEVLRAPGFMDFLETGLPTPFDAESMAALHSAAATERTERSLIEQKLQGLYNEMHRSADAWLSALKTDTLDWEGDSLPVAYEKHPALFAQYALAGRYLVAHDADRLEALIDHIAADSFFATASPSEHTRYTALCGLLKNTELSRRYWGQPLDSATQAALEAFSGGDDAAADGVSQKALAVLRSFGGRAIGMEESIPAVGCVPEVVHRPAPAPNNATSRAALLPRIADEVFTGGEKSVLRLAPNPAKEVVTVSYAVPRASGALQLRVLSAEGKLLSSVPLSGAAGTLRLPVEGLPTGVYIVEIRSGAKTLGQAKLQVMR